MKADAETSARGPAVATPGRPGAAADRGHPRVVASVVIPTAGRADLLRRCLEALEQQTFSRGPWEIVVVDDTPRDRPADAARRAETEALVGEAARRAAERRGPAIRYLANPGPHGPAAARNAGWRAARAEIIAFTDDDCLPQPQWLDKGVAAFTDGIAGVSGLLLVPVPARPSDYERNAAHLASAEFVTANCFYRRSALVLAGGFDERFRTAWREDSDLFFTLLENGRRLEHVPDAVVVHPIRPAPWGVSLRQQRKSMYNALLRAKHPRLYRERIQPSPLFYYPVTAGLLLAAALFYSGRRRRGLAAGLFWLAATLGFAARRLRDTSHEPRHVAEMLATSAAIPPLSLFWRLYGAVKYRWRRP